MPYAPRPFETSPYIKVSSGEKTGWLEACKDIFTAQNAPYIPASKRPLCYPDNIAILRQLGFEKNIDAFINQIIEPDKEILFPECGRDYTDAHFVQGGMLLSKNQDSFTYELSGRLHFVGAVFCRTPDYIIEDLEQHHLPSGPWMLDQMTFSEQGKSSNLMYNIEHFDMTRHVTDLLERVKQVNQAFEDLEDHMDIASLFYKLMDEFDNKNRSQLKSKNPVRPRAM